MGLTLYCASCYDEKSEHYFGFCHGEHAVMGGSDNMDMDIMLCECRKYEPEFDAPDYGEEADEWQ